MEQVRQAQLELPLWVGEVFNHVRNGVELADAVTGLYFCLFIRIGDDLSFARFAMTDLIVARHSLSFGTARGISLGLAERVGFTIHHFPGNAGVLDFRVAVGKAPPLLFLLFWGGNNLPCGLKQVFEMFGHGLPPVRSKDNTIINV
jgi:hypothetical protein